MGEVGLNSGALLVHCGAAGLLVVGQGLLLSCACMHAHGTWPASGSLEIHRSSLGHSFQKKIPSQSLCSAVLFLCISYLYYYCLRIMYVSMSCTFSVVICIDLPDLNYRFPPVIDTFSIE